MDDSRARARDPDAVRLSFDSLTLDFSELRRTILISIHQNEDSGFFGAETSRQYVAELLLFILITGISAWPIISAIVAVTRLVRNY